DDGGETATLRGTMGPSTTRITFADGAMRYDSRSEGGDLAVSGSSIPLPEVTIGLGAVEATLLAPLVADAAPQPYAFGMSLLGLALDEGLWNMIDPAGVLPRDPGEMLIDLAGEVILASDIDPTG